MTARKRKSPTATARPSSVAELGAEQRREQIARQGAHLLRTLTQTAAATVVIGAAFLLTGNSSLHQMAPYLFAWSAGWALASVILRVQRRASSGRRSDER